MALGGDVRREHEDRRAVRDDEVPGGARSRRQQWPRHRRQASRTDQGAVPHPLIC